MPGRILIIDDDAGFSRSIARNLKRNGHDVATCGTASDARREIAAMATDVVVLDYQLPDADGLELLGEIKRAAPGAELMMATAYPDLDVAVEAMRRGAFDYVAKGSDARECLMRIERAVEVSSLRHRMAEASHPTVAAPTTSTTPHQGLLGNSEAMRKLRQRLDALCGSDDTTALLLGETGSGKSLVARAIHAASGRAYEPFVAVDCTTIPATLVESELFGHEKGSFSGAHAAKQGRVEAAGRGTLFLDEIGELDLPMQAKLLRLLEEREFTRVGSTRTRRLQARIITATNRDLARAVQEGRFRNDLRYRLEVFVVEVPPLRARGDDILSLTSHFAAERSRAVGKPRPRLSQDLMDALVRYRFPGNVRELRNMVEQAVLLSKGDELTIADFPVLTRQEPDASRGTGDGRGQDADARHGGERSGEPRGDGSAFPPPPRRPTTPPRGTPRRSEAPNNLDTIRKRHADQERKKVVHALEATGGNVSAAARELGWSRHRLIRRLSKYGLR